MALGSLAPHTPSGVGEYSPPVREYEFLLSEVFGEDLVARATGGELSTDDAVDALEGAGEFASQILAPLNRIGDTDGVRLIDGQAVTPDGFREAYRSFTDAGWITAMQGPSSGGDGLPNSVRQALTEFWNGSNLGFALLALLSSGQIHALDACASEELRETFMKRLVSGEWTGTMNLTEPQAGSDLGAITSIARRNGDGTWSVSGQKIFISWGDHDLAENIVHLVLARTEGAPEGHRGLSLFIVPKFHVGADGSIGARNAVETVAIEHKLGLHASPTCVLQFNGAVGHLVGELHAGLQGMFVMMNAARIGVGVQGLAVAERAYQRARDYAYQRLQGRVLDLPTGTPIAGHPDVRRLLLSISSRISAMRAFSVMVGDQMDRAEAAGNTGPEQTLLEFYVPLFKSWLTESSVQIASDALQVHGGAGYVEETGAAQHFRDARILPIYEGTTAIQSNDLVGRKVLRDGGATAAQVFAAIRESLDSLRGSDHPVARRVAERTERAVQSAERATRAVLEFAASPRDAYAVSVPFQELLATLIGGQMHARMVGAVLAHETLTDEDQRRLTEADFFGAHHLSNVHALAEAVAAGEIV